MITSISQVAGISLATLALGAAVLFMADPCHTMLHSVFKVQPLGLQSLVQWSSM